MNNKAIALVVFGLLVAVKLALRTPDARETGNFRPWNQPTNTADFVAF